jgi:hypothetical protein
MFHSINILYKKGIKKLLIINFGLFIVISLVPSFKANINCESNDELIFIKNTTDKYFVNCVLFVIGEIENPRIEEIGNKKYLLFYAKEVFVSGFYAGYDGYIDVTQWIYDEEVKLSWKGSGLKFRGIITDDFIFGIQRARYI